MAIRNIIQNGDPVLHKTSRKVELFDDKLAQVLDDMWETMRAENGCGLAAVQVGLLRRVCIVDTDDGKPVELINPEIVSTRGIQEEQEGCLSSPGDYAITRRPMWVRVKAFDRRGKAFMVTGEGLKARAFCHEIDHLNGVLFREHVICELPAKNRNTKNS